MNPPGRDEDASRCSLPGPWQISQPRFPSTRRSGVFQGIPPSLSRAVDSSVAPSIENPAKWQAEHLASKLSVRAGTVNVFVIVSQKLDALMSRHGHRVRS